MLIPAPELYMDFVNVPKPIEVAKFIVAQVARSPLRFTATSTSTDLTIDLSTQSRDGLGIASASHLPAHKRNALQSFMSAHPDEKARLLPAVWPYFIDAHSGPILFFVLSMCRFNLYISQQCGKRCAS
jgi:hypothetical protein